MEKRSTSDRDSANEDGARKSSLDFLKDYPPTEAVYDLLELITYIYSHWKAVKCPPELKKVVKRTSQIMTCQPPDDHYSQERLRKFINVENSGTYSVPWKPYAELGTTELNISNLVLNNLVPSFKLEEKPLADSSQGSERVKKKRTKGAVRMPTLIYPFPEEEQFGELTAYNLIKESLDFITEISEDLKNPRRNLQEVYERKKKEFKTRRDVKEKEMVFIPFKAVDHTAAQETVEAEVEKFSTKLRAILDIVHTLMNLEDEDVKSKLPLCHLATVRLKRSKDVGIPKSIKPMDAIHPDIAKEFTDKEISKAKEFFGRPEPIWQNKYKVTGVIQHGSVNIRYEPYDLVNQLRGVLIRATEKIRSGGIYLLKRLEAEFDRRYKYTSLGMQLLALSSLPLILIQESEIAHYAELLKSIVDKAAYAKGNPELLKNDKDLAMYLLGELDDALRDVLQIATDDQETYMQEMPKAVWFQMLENEADVCGLLREPRIRKLLDQIYEFHTLELPKVKHIHEKFCLLVTSAPMEEVCSKPWQTAAKFIHEHIMEAPEGMIEYWLAERGIPLHIKRQGLR